MSVATRRYLRTEERNIIVTETMRHGKPQFPSPTAASYALFSRLTAAPGIDRASKHKFAVDMKKRKKKGGSELRSARRLLKATRRLSACAQQCKQLM